MAFAGIRGSGSWGTDERPKSFRDIILWKNPNGRAPLTALLARARKQGVDDPEFNWWEEALQLTRVTVNYSTGYGTTANTIVIDSVGLTLVAGDVLQIEMTETATYDAEIAVVSSVTSDTVIVIKRGIAETTNVDLADNAALTKIGNVFEEGSSAPAISLRNPTKKTNYCQIFKTAIGITGTAEQVKARTGDAWANDKKRKAFDHSVAMEMSFMFGRPYEDTTGTYPKRYTGGLRYFITTNVTCFTTTPTADTFLDSVYKVFDYESGGAGDERIIFCGNGFLNSLNKIAKNATNSQITFNKVVDLYGMKLPVWIAPQGRFGIKTHPLMNVHPVYTNSAFIVDPTSLVYRPLRDTKFKENIQDNDADLRKGQWLTEAGLEVQHEETMGYISNFVA
jgi:hypothetical protein